MRTNAIVFLTALVVALLATVCNAANNDAPHFNEVFPFPGGSNIQNDIEQLAYEQSVLRTRNLITQIDQAFGVGKRIQYIDAYYPSSRDNIQNFLFHPGARFTELWHQDLSGFYVSPIQYSADRLHLPHALVLLHIDQQNVVRPYGFAEVNVEGTKGKRFWDEVKRRADTGEDFLQKFGGQLKVVEGYH